MNLEWGDGSFCHFNSFVNVFMNAINTSFTLLCFWIPLGCGVCQFPSPRRQPAPHNISLSCVAEHWQTQFTKGKSELTPRCGSGSWWEHTTHFIPRGNPPSLSSGLAHKSVEARRDGKLSGWHRVKSLEVRERQGPRPYKGKPATVGTTGCYHLHQAVREG